MATCRNCGGTFTWGNLDGKWVMLEPVETHGDLDRTYVDENGELRADHRDRHPGGSSVNVARLDRKVKADDVAEETVKHKVAARAARLVGRRSG